MISGHVETCGPMAHVWLPSTFEGSRGGCGREVRKESRRWRQRYGHSARCALEPQPMAKCLGRVAAPVLIIPLCSMSPKCLKLLKREHENASRGSLANPPLASIGA